MKIAHSNHIYEEITTPNNPNFKSWFGNSKIVWPNGEPRIVYHGTTNDFSSFDMGFAREGNLGKGFYFSSSPDDAGGHYGCELGPDAKSHRDDFISRKIQDMIYDIIDSTDNNELINETLKEFSKDQIKKILAIKTKNQPKTGTTNITNITLRVQLEEYLKPIVGREFDDKYRKNCGNVMPVYLKMENPFIIGGKNESNIEITCDEADPDDEDSFSEVNGRALELYEIFQKMNLTPSDDWMECGSMISARDIINELRKDPNSSIVVDEFDGEGEALKKIIAWLDYDGIIDTTVSIKFSEMKHLEAGDVHYIVFEPYQIKSVFNSGNWNPNNPDVTLEEAT